MDGNLWKNIKFPNCLNNWFKYTSYGKIDIGPMGFAISCLT